ncbi:Fc.00g008670.m01.CDS01 [Cosmosporella sp. VM-42]
MTIPPPNEYGYDRLGRLMGRYGEMSIFRRFGALSAEKLLHLQGELQGLEIELLEQQEEDRTSCHPDRRKYHRSWTHAQASGDSDAPEGNDSRQLELLKEIDEKLTRYHGALLQHQQIMKLQKPTKKQVHALVDWMDRPDRGDIMLIGPDREIWSKPDMHDLAIMDSTDVLTSKMTPDLVYWYHRIIGRHIHKAETSSADLKNTVLYDNNRVYEVMKTLATLLACLLLMASIAVLYIIHSMPLRIGVTAIFTCAFSFCLSASTDANVKDIFSATATFSAVLVVFIGTNDSAS